MPGGGGIALSATSSQSRDSSNYFRRISVLGPPSLFPSQRSFESRDRKFRDGEDDDEDDDDQPTDFHLHHHYVPYHHAGGKHGEKFMREESAEEIAATTADLDFYYGLIKRQLLRFQSPTTGLFPEMSSHKTEGCVRSSIYANMAAWSLFQSYKRIDDDRGKSHELAQCAVFGMRGILMSWMRQSEKLERFKFKQTPGNALHSKFHLDTGDVLYDYNHYNHLQIDVVSLYLLFLTQMIYSGLSVIFTMEEFSFVQNLVYYVERAYRTPDFGMWERGTKFNDGKCEIHASSIGMAKAALEAINGCNVFGDKGAAWSVIYVDIDAHNRNRSIFETLLPRESSSKSADSSLLATISFPAFATHNQDLYDGTKKMIVDELEGKCGFKRFLRDGYGCVLEPEGQRFYSEGFIQTFEDVECEWPIFFSFMVIDGVFRQNTNQVEEYLGKLKHRMFYNEAGDPVFPKYYFVAGKDIEEEKSKPGSCHRRPINNGCDSNDLFIWGQSMLIMTDLLTTHLIYPHEIDPIRRYLPSYSRPKSSARYSTFQAPLAGLVLQIVTIAESRRLQSVLATYGIQSQTPNEIEPVQIWPQTEMVRYFESLGACKSLGLSGRPPRPVGSLGTSKVYRMLGQTIICYPLVFSDSQFYLSSDVALLTEDIKSELVFVSKCWRMGGRPTICVIVTENHMRDCQFPVMLDFLAQFQTGRVDGVKLRVGRVQNLLASSCIEHLDFLSQVSLDKMEGTPFAQVTNEKSTYMTLTDIPIVKSVTEEKYDFRGEFKNKPSNEIVTAILSCTHLYGTIQMLGILLSREGPDFMVGELPVKTRLEIWNKKAVTTRHWEAVRCSSALLQQTVESISPYVTQILVNGKQVTVGTVGADYALFDKPLTPGEIKKAIFEKVHSEDMIAPSLQQELILHCGKLISTNPELFDGILKLRMGWILRALSHYRRMKQDDSIPLEACSPCEIRRLLVQVLNESRALQLSYGKIKEKHLDEIRKSDILSIFQVRQINGCLNRVPPNFYEDLLMILKRSPGGIYLAKTFFEESLVTLFGSNDETFSHLAENAFNDIFDPEFKQLAVELLCVMGKILKRNPELKFTEKIDVSSLINEAIAIFKKDQDIPTDERSVFYNSPVHTTSGYLARAIINSVLKGSMGSSKGDPLSDYNCPVQ